MTQQENAIRQMNELGARREPFLFIVDFEMNAPLVLPAQQAEHSGIYYSVNQHTNCGTSARRRAEFAFTKRPVDFDEYRQAFEQVLNHLHEGNSYLVNLTFPTPVETSLTLEEIFGASSARYRLLFKDLFVVFSPEIFVQIRDGMISSFPMKGTIDAGVEDAEAKILGDPKELAEHATIVDLIRNDLHAVARDVQVERFRYVDRIRTNMKDLLQVSSRITGRLPAGYHSQLGTILFALLPAGSVTGAPKKKTVEIIKAVERYERGYYTGVMGYFDGENLDSGVMIRFIERTTGGLVYKSGGGITVFSTAENEYEELVDKVYVPIV
jgi:para-aminobenzoate synthetase component 1